MKPACIGRVLIVLGWMIMMESHPAGYAAEPVLSAYTLNQVVQLALQHNPVMNGAEALVLKQHDVVGAAEVRVIGLQGIPELGGDGTATFDLNLKA